MVAAGKTELGIGPQIDTSDPRVSGLARLVYGPHATEKGVARDKARIADAGFGWLVGAGERTGLVPGGTRGALREAALEAEEEYNLAHPGGGLGRAISEAGQTAVAGMLGPQALLGAGAGGLAARGAAALGAGRALAAAAGAVGGALEGGAQNYLDVVDLPPEEQARAILSGAALGTLGGALTGRAAGRVPRETVAGGAEAPQIRPEIAPEPPPAGSRNLPDDSGSFRSLPELSGNSEISPEASGSIRTDRRSNLGLRQEVDAALARLREEAPDADTLGRIQARAEVEGDRALELATERYAFEKGQGFFGPPRALDAGLEARPAPETGTRPSGGEIVPPGGAEREIAIPRPEPRGVAVTERGRRIAFNYEIRDASELVTSHDDALRPNPAFPAEVQPRERGRAASAAQVARIEQQLNPELLGASPRVSDGAPFIGPDGVVESGNARSIAVRRSYRSGSPGAEAYREWLRDQAPRLGLDPGAVDQVPNPVLVRVRRTAVDRPTFAREANESAVAGFSAAERAAADAQLITPDMLDSLRLLEGGGVNLGVNRDFVRAFASQVAPTEHAGLFDARGALSIEGERRIQNAILARAYGDPAAVAKLTEHADNNVRAVGAALLREAPRFARMREGIAAGRLHPLDITADVGAALRKLSALRDEGTKVGDYLAQEALFGPELTTEARALLALFDANRGSARVGEILGRYADAVEGLGSPDQVRMFGEVAIPSRLELLAGAAPGEQRALLDAATADTPAVAPRPPVGETRPPVGRPARPASLPGIEAPSSTPFKMSTKGLENFAPPLKEDVHRLATEHRGAIAKARGPVKPASRWHDAQGLADDLGMTPEEFLDSPAGRTFSDDELSLGRHYLGAMRREVSELAGKLSRGEIPAEGVEAAKDRLARLNIDTVRMMATLQGKGASVAGRSLRSLQEELDPYGLASTPHQKLQLALLKHYGAKNADEAAKIEARAVARLKRQAALEARKAGRVATREDLAQEFTALSAEFGRLSRTPRTGLDPELVAIIGKMAANRVKAGVVAVEQLADEIFEAARQHVEGLRREDVKAAIVEHVLAPKPRKVQKGPERSAGDRRLAAAEGRVARQIQALEKRLATGPGKPKARQAPPDSPRLQELRRRAAELKGQIAKDPREGLAARYRELLDDQTVELIARLPADPGDPALLSFLRQMEKPSFRDFRTTYWINSVLSGTKTLARNLTGNAVRLAELTAMRPAGAVVEAGLARAQGRAPERLLRETVPATVGVFRGIPEGLKRFAFVMREGYDPGRLVAELTEGANDAARFDQRLPVSPFLLSERKGVRAAGAVLTLPTRILEATDAMAKVMAATSERYAWATRKAVQEGAPDVAARVADLLQEMPEEMLEAERAFAKRATYQDPLSWVGRSASAIRRGVPGAAELARDLRAKGGLGNRALAGAVQLPETIGQHLLPFIHISDRVAAAVTDYIPGAKPAKLARLVAEQSPEAADLIARQVVGGALTMLGITWAAEGKLVGAAPKEEKLKNDFYSSGKQPYSVLVGGHWVPIRDLLGPLAGPFVAAAMYNDHVRVGEDPSTALAGMALGTSRYLLDASYMATLQQVIEAVEAAGPDVGRGITSAGARVAGGYVPYSGLLRGVAIARDPRVVDKQGFLDELKAGLPGLREQLPPRLDSQDQPLIQNTGAAGGFSPIVPTRSTLADPSLAEEVERMRYTLTQGRAELRRLEQQLEEARKLRDAARAREILQQLPRGTSAADLDGVMEEVRALEAEIRELRASDRPEEAKQAGEIRKQQRMKQILERALARLKR